MMELLLELDIRHTSQVKNIIEEASREGRLNPILSQLKDLGGWRDEDKRGEGTSMSI